MAYNLPLIKHVNLLNSILEVCALKIKIKKNYMYCSPAGKRSLGRPRRRWEDNFRMYLKEIGINTRNWVD